MLNPFFSKRNLEAKLLTEIIADASVAPMRLPNCNISSTRVVATLLRRWLCLTLIPSIHILFLFGHSITWDSAIGCTFVEVFVIMLLAEVVVLALFVLS